MTNIYLHIEKEHIVFLSNNNTILVINTGYQKIIEQHFRHALPTPYEMEIAIITIEEAIEHGLRTAHNQWQKDIIVKSCDEWIKEIAIYTQSHEKIATAALEQLFNRVADVVSGGVMYKNEFSNNIEFISYLLIIRELIHHLGINGIEMSP